MAVSCPGVGFDTILRGDPDDRRITWLEDVSSGRRKDTIWPAGTAARFTPHLEVVSPMGEVVMREGGHVVGGCVTAEENVYLIGWP